MIFAHVAIFAIIASLSQEGFCEMRDMKFCDMRDYGEMKELDEKIKAWLRTELNGRGHGSRTKFAAALGIKPDTVTRLVNDEPGKETKALSAIELILAIQHFEACPAFVLAGDPALQKFIEIAASFSAEDRRTAIEVGEAYLETRRSKMASAR
jgi:hypothetical protein